MRAIKISDRFTPLGKDEYKKAYEENVDVLNKAIDEIVAKQLDMGLDIVNDGELPRETYVLHFVRNIKGIDTDNLVSKTVRNGKSIHLY